MKNNQDTSEDQKAEIKKMRDASINLICDCIDSSQNLKSLEG